MTVQKLHLDLIDYRKGRITLDDLRRLFPTWRVSKDYARFCVKCAQESLAHETSGDLFA